MQLMFPRSMVIPEALQRLDDANFEDWLTAALIETTSQTVPQNKGARDAHLLPVRVTDLWMLEMAERNGKIWTGKFQVELEKKEEERLAVERIDLHPNEVFFVLDTQTAKITFRAVIAEQD
jgi:hypothetical protein